VNPHALAVLEFPEALRAVAARAGSPLGREALLALGPSSDPDHVRAELARLLPTLYPGVFPRLATLNNRDRADLLAPLRAPPRRCDPVRHERESGHGRGDDADGGVDAFGGG
jgi:hypothetical protein